MKKVCLTALILALLLTGCGQQAQPAAVEAMAQTQMSDKKIITVSPGAVEDFLDLEICSSERQYAPEYVMLHFCSAVVEHRDDPYNMEYVRKTFTDNLVSIHYIIDRDGTVYCYVPEDRVAWHAGKGEWNGDETYTNTMNRYSIGIELVAIGSQQDMSLYLSKQEFKALDRSLLGYTDAQYQALTLLLEDICMRNRIPMDRDHVIGHEEYSPQKNDPGELFDWSRLFP